MYFSPIHARFFNGQFLLAFSKSAKKATVQDFCWKIFSLFTTNEFAEFC